MGIDISLINDKKSEKFLLVKEGNTVTSTLNVSAPGAGQYGSGSTTDTIAHNLGYIPIVLAFLLLGSEYYILPYNNINGDFVTGSNIANWSSVVITSDFSNIYINQQILVYNTSASLGPWNLKYFLYKTKAN